MPLLKLDNTTMYLFVILLYTSILLSTNNCSVDLYNGDLQTATVFFKRNFTQGWLNSYYSSSALSCPFIVQHKHSNEHTWTRTFVFLSSRELYCDFIVVCACIVFSPACSCWFTWNVFDVFVSVYLCRVLNDITLFLFA